LLLLQDFQSLRGMTAASRALRKINRTRRSVFPDCRPIKVIAISQFSIEPGTRSNYTPTIGLPFVHRNSQTIIPPTAGSLDFRRKGKKCFASLQR
jgi:hypothetical protein